MTKVDALFNEASRLSALERAEPIERGLHQLTESTRHEDWSSYYPDSLRQILEQRKKQ